MNWRCLFITIALLPLASATSSVRTESFAVPIDAVSFRMPTDATHLSVRGFDGQTWTPWETMTIEKEFDPLLRETNLVLFPRPVQTIEVRGTTLAFVTHPIRVSSTPARWQVAALTAAPTPRILSRAQWGADDSFLFQGAASARSDVPNPDINAGNGESVPPQRLVDCEEAQRLYPDEFKALNRTTRDPRGRTYRWPLSYSPKVKLLVIHHTAQTTTGDARAGIERVRALYAYHSNSRGWGDIGYHYVIDETGQIYEGKAGGPFVVGGHAYCDNVGTIGVAMLGNFEVEQPSQDQVHALQWLLSSLASTYDIATDRDVRFHGKIYPPIIGHRDLLSTDCPGSSLYGALGQVRQNVRTGQVNTDVTFPVPVAPAVDRVSERKAKRVAEEARKGPITQGLDPIGALEINGAPGARMAFSMRFLAGPKSWRKGESVGKVGRSDQGIGLWQEMDGSSARVRTTVNLPAALASSDTTVLRFTLQFPSDPGDYALSIGDWTYALHVSGRRVRSRGPVPQTAVRGRAGGRELGVGSSSKPATFNLQPATGKPASQQTITSPHIRIRLSYAAPTARLLLPNATSINGVIVEPSTVTLSIKDGGCVTDIPEANEGGIILINPGPGAVTIDSWGRAQNRFRGFLECRVVDGALTLINDLPLEQYLAGLSEEGDSEPFEKQRAFAVAARTYAAYYVDPLHRKFPGKPYDGSDSPAEFQAYGGAATEDGNPQWVQAVQSTAGQVLMKDGALIKSPYFHSDDGRTRAPAEVGPGWAASIPFPEIFVSKPDPWCAGMTLSGHGVGMSGCGALGQAKEGKKAEEILEYYYPGTTIGNGK